MSNAGRVYVKRTSPQTNRVVITAHSVWDQDRFLATQQEAQRALRQEGKDYDTITIASEQEYRELNWPKKA
ncbi:MAG: hypothetical protein U1E51_16895 [Candidatus Binatia bacterium]|nr:hypothetical protein [Candidatus Binatia bacterium]